MSKRIEMLVVNLKLVSLIILRPFLTAFCKPTIDRAVLRSQLVNQLNKLKGETWSASRIDLLPETFEWEISEGRIKAEVYLLDKDHVQEKRKRPGNNTYSKS